MLACVLYLLHTVVAEGYRSPRVKELFEAYKERFGHGFGDDDDYRMAAFEDNLRYIEEENAKGLSYTLKITPFTHLTNAEFRDTMFGRFPESQAPLVTKGWVTEVKNQGSCGSCWAFSATGALEGLHKNVSGELVSLSEEELIDCSSKYNNMGCVGGLPNQAFQYVADHGLESEKDYPYQSKNASPLIPVVLPCDSESRKDVIKAHSVSHVNVKPKSKSSLLAAVASAGPISVGLDGWSKAFQHYGGGVLDSGCYPATNHAVLTVGYDMEAKKP
ncbi:hypothetical protein FOZ63_020495 [Perkinsus olseni]|uniref:Cathepsin L n=2 Tax=Perkinsus olseni TaxID=32597 RepID=A0A7J6QDP5_PEROL|nr:hypothetical protein FOZ63_020495 [Perkinsus olseni]